MKAYLEKIHKENWRNDNTDKHRKRHKSPCVRSRWKKCWNHNKKKRNQNTWHQSKNRELKCVLGGNKCRTKNKRNQKILIEMIFRRKEYVKTESRNIKKCLIKKTYKQKEETLKNLAQEKRKEKYLNVVDKKFILNTK